MEFSRCVDTGSIVRNISVLNGTSPSIVTYEGTLFFFFSGSGRNGIFCMTRSLEGQESWSNLFQILHDDGGTNMNGTSSPAAVVLREGDTETLFLFWSGAGVNDYSGPAGLWYTTFDGTTWSSAQFVPVRDAECVSNSSPAVAVSGSTLYLFYINSSGLNCTTLESAWSSPGTLISADSGATGSPSACFFDGSVHVFWATAASGTTSISLATGYGSSWSSPRSLAIATGNVTGSPVCGTFGPGSALYLFWTNSAGNNINYSWNDGMRWSFVMPVYSKQESNIITSGTNVALASHAGRAQLAWVSSNQIYWAVGKDVAASLSNISQIYERFQRKEDVVFHIDDKSVVDIFIDAFDKYNFPLDLNGMAIEVASEIFAKIMLEISRDPRFLLVGIVAIISVLLAVVSGLAVALGFHAYIYLTADRQRMEMRMYFGPVWRELDGEPGAVTDRSGS